MKEARAAGNHVITILGARNKELLFWEDRFQAISDEVIVTTDDGSYGHKGLVTERLAELIESRQIAHVTAIGPLPMMKYVALTTQDRIPTTVSLNTLMVDGTGMCGGCRYQTSSGETRFACVDGPDVDGHDVDFDNLLQRNRRFIAAEEDRLERYHEKCQALESAKKAKKVIIKEKYAMPVQPVVERIRNFEEVALGYSEKTAIAEAQRCLLCKNRNCVDGCPVEVPIPEFIKLIVERKFEEGLRILKEKNVLPGICGRVCPQETQCEKVCTLGKAKGSEPVAIGRLERFLADWDLAHSNGRGLTSPLTFDPLDRPKVAIIGSGPAGLTCASELAVQGYHTTIFEAFHTTGGVLTYGIPEFRLPKEIVRKEIENLKELGVEIRVNSVIGKTLTINDLREMGYQAFFVGVGAGLPSFLKIPGTEYNGVLSANEYLTRVNLMRAYDPDYDTLVDRGKHVAVLGGGNVAMDAARTALRLGAEKVMIIYRRSESELPAREEEYHHAIEEGIEFHFLRNPTKILGNERGFVTSMEILKMELGEPDDSGRRRPIPIQDSAYSLDVDLVIMAIGANANPLLTQSTPGLELNRWGYIEVNDDMQSSIPDVFAGGDIVTGAATVISAMGAGKQAAASIHTYLQEKSEPVLA